LDQPQYLSPTGRNPDEPGMTDRCDLAPNRPVAPPIAAIKRSGYPLDARALSWTNLFDPRQPEAFLAFCSLWCSMQMCIWPDEFAAQNALAALNMVTRAVGLRGHEQVWSVFGASASLLKLAGLACRLGPRWEEFSNGLRASGLFMSIVFWMIVGLSRMMDFPHLITPVALTGLGVAAAFQLAERRDPRDTWK